MGGSGISWAICKSAPRFRQITMPAPHHSVFLQAGCPSCRPTNSVKALKAHYWHCSHNIQSSVYVMVGRLSVPSIAAAYRSLSAVPHGQEISTDSRASAQQQVWGAVSRLQPRDEAQCGLAAFITTAFWHSWHRSTLKYCHLTRENYQRETGFPLTSQDKIIKTSETCSSKNRTILVHFMLQTIMLTAKWGTVMPCDTAIQILLVTHAVTADELKKYKLALGTCMIYLQRLLYDNKKRITINAKLIKSGHFQDQ